MHDVLISYSTKDQKWADAACSVLEARGIRCWIAPRDIIPGTEWGEAIIAGIDACKVMVLIFSASANASPQVRREVERAISKGLTIVPCRIENVLPVGAMEYALGNTHWLDVFTPPVERQMKRLAESVRALLPRHRGATSVTGRAPLASATGPNESLSESNIPGWNWRGKHGRIAAAGFISLLLVAISLGVFLPRKDAASTPEKAALIPEKVPAGQTASTEKSQVATTSAASTQGQPVAPADKTPAADYEQLATGHWVPALPSPAEFDRLLAQNSYFGRPPKFDGGLLELRAPPGQGGNLQFPSIQAKNVIIRARVRKQSPRPPQVPASNIGLAVRCPGNYCTALLTGRRRFVIGTVKEGKFVDLKTCMLAENYDEGFFEFAFAAIEDKLTAYVDGREILRARIPTPDAPGRVQVAVASGGGVFKDIEVQVLDMPIVTARTSPAR